MKIKTHETVRDIKIFDRAANVATHTQNAVVKIKENAKETQGAGHHSPEEYAANRTTEAAYRTIRKSTKPFHRFSHNKNAAKRNFIKAKRHINELKNTLRTATESSKTIKGSRQTINTAPKGTAKATRTIKTAKTTATTTAKTTQKTLHTARRAAQSTAKAAQATRAAAKAAAQSAKLIIKIINLIVRAIIASVKSLVSAILAGGWIAVIVIIVICLVALLLGSVFGIFFSSEDTGSGQTMPMIISDLTTEFYKKIDDIKTQNPHDIVDIDAMSIPWNEILAVYAVKVNMDQEKPTEVVSLDEAKVEMLRSVLNDMVSLSYTVKTETQKRTVTDDDGNEKTEEISVKKLIVSLDQKSADDMASQYKFNDKQKALMHELLSPEYAHLWAQLLGGYSNGNGDIIMTDSSHTPIGILSWPLPGDYPVSSQFGYRKDPFSGEPKSHGGIDMRVPGGIAILAAADGTVIAANASDSWGGGYGYYVKIQHNSVYATLYAHCSKISVSNGQYVRKGQVIGYVGSTGRSTGDHLHFEVYQNGARVNPLGFYK